MNEQVKVLLEMIDEDRKLMHEREGDSYEYTARVLDGIVTRFIIHANLKGWIEWEN